MQTKMLLIHIVLTLILLSGCAQQQTPTDYTTKTQGINIKILQDMPTETWEQTSFEIPIELENKGSSNANGYLTLEGFSPAYITINPTYHKFSLQKISQTNPQGDYTLLTFKATIKKLQDIALDYIEQPIRATACYIYSTKLTIPTCITSGEFTKEEQVCKPKDTTLTAQGAPIAITKVEQKIIPLNNNIDIYYTFHIKHLGNGIPTRQSLVNKECTSQTNIPSYQLFNRVYVNKLQLFPDIYYNTENYCNNKNNNKCIRVDLPFEKDCHNNEDISNVIILDKNNEATATYKCTLPKEKIQTKAYITPLTIELKYGYRIYDSKTIKINKKSQNIKT